MSPWLLLGARSVAGALSNMTSWFSFVPIWAMLGLFGPYWTSSFTCFVALCFLRSLGSVGPALKYKRFVLHMFSQFSLFGFGKGALLL